MLLPRASWPYPLWDFFSPRLLAVARTAISPGCHWGRLANFLKAKRGWLRFRIRTSCRPMAKQRTRRAGSGVSRVNNSRFLPLTARISAVRYAGFRNLVSLCVRAMGEHTTEMAPALPGHQSAAFLNIHTKLTTAWSPSRLANCQHREQRSPNSPETNRHAHHECENPACRDRSLV